MKFYNDPGEARAAGIPEPIVKLVEGLGRWRDANPITKPRPMPRGSFEEVRDRIERMTKYWRENPDKDDLFRKAWRSVERSAYTEAHLTDLFLKMPDGPDKPNFLLIPFERAIDIGEQRNRQLDLLENVDKIIEFFYNSKKLPDAEKNKNNEAETKGNNVRAKLHNGEISKSVRFLEGRSRRYMELSQDARTTSDDGQKAYEEFDELRYEFLTGLKKFKAFIEIADPGAKVPTKHWKSEDAPIKNYYAYLAALNHNLKTPQHVALAFIATANNPQVPVEPDMIRKYWSRNAEKPVSY